MKYFKEVTIILTNGKEFKSKILDTKNNIQSMYRIGGYIYGQGEIKEVKIKILRNVKNLKNKY